MTLSMRTWIQRAAWMLGVTGFSLAAVALFFPGVLLIQGRPEHSLPFHLALRLALPRTWHVDDLVQFRVRDLRPYYVAGTAFVKRVAALPGDRLRLDGQTFFVNNTPVATARTTDVHGRPAAVYTPLPDSAGTCRLVAHVPDVQHAECTLGPDTVFVLGAHARSYDSRYWGLVQTSEMTARVLPLW